MTAATPTAPTSPTTIRRCILIAAGRGKRLGPHTEDIPKCMVDVAGRPILGWVWRALAAVGVDELIVIRGYKGDVLERFVTGLVPRATFVDNHEWESNNVLLSLACARPFLDRATYLTYSDIVFTPAVARAAAQSSAEIGLVIDREFRAIYEGRTEHPLDEGEVADLMPDGTVARVGKRALPPADAIGEFIGLSRLGARGAALAGDALDQLAKRYAGRDHEPFQRAGRYRNAYLTDLWQELIDHGVRVDPILISGQWREIDTGQDLDRARHLLQSGAKEWT
jgi:L-glutamine-phosphate cytidylyltransferase